MNVEEVKKKITPILRNVEKELSMEDNSLEFVRIITGGFSTSNILIKTTDDKNYLLRMYPRKEENYSEKEFEIMKCVMESKCSHLAPKAFLCDSSKKVVECEYCIFEFLPGLTQKHTYLKGKKDLVLELGKDLREIHDSLPKLGEQEFKYIQEAPKEDYTLMGQWDKRITSKLREPTELVQKLMKEHGGFEDFKKTSAELYDKAVSVTKSTVEGPLFKDAPRNTFIHNDYHVNNMLFEEKSKEEEGEGENVLIIPRVIDWEHARFGNIYEDIAMFTSTSGLEEGNKAFFQGYFGGGEDYLSRMDIEVYDLMFLRKKFFLFAFLLLILNEANAKMMCMYLGAVYKEISGLLKKYE